MKCRNFLHYRKDQEYAIRQIIMILGPQMADISVKNQRANLNTGQYNIFKIQKYTYETLNDAVRQPVSTP